MKRREVLKNIGLATGFFVATPSIISLLQSCTNDVKTWMPEFLTQEQGTALIKLVDIFLPKTENLPSATDLNIPQFIDKYLNETLDSEEQAHYKTALNTFINLLNPNAEISIDTITEEDYKKVLDTYLLVKDEIDEERETNLESLEFTKSEFLNNIKTLTISAYLINEKIGKTVLKYDPVPSQYYCGDLQELTGGVSWSLGNNFVM